jgi:hypothetical protein
LYLRVTGTSHTQFRITDYAQLRYDTQIDLNNLPSCPLCGADIVIWGDPIEGGEGRYIAQVYYRDRQ